MKLLDASKESKSRSALANARTRKSRGKTFDEWLSRYQSEVLDMAAPGQPLMHNDFMGSQEGYKERAWRRWREDLSLGTWGEGAKKLECVRAGELSRDEL